MTEFDIVIVGAGIAGASLAAEIAGHRTVLLLEAESQPGYHSTGRSAAFWDEIYGGPLVQPLTTASGPFLANPPANFHDGPLMHRRGALHVGTDNHAGFASNMLADFARSGVNIEVAKSEILERLVPGIRSEWSHGLWEPTCCDIDVAALHASYLRQAARLGARLSCNSRLQRADWRNSCWHIDAGDGGYTARTLVNAAGAWADNIAGIAGVSKLGIQPYRRTIAQLSVSPAAAADMPLVIALDGSFYFKPDAGGKLWLSPHDETATPACDVAPDELDVAMAIDRLQQAVDWDVKRVEHKWAGLRSFAPDRLPVIGPDPTTPAFFWLVGQGGFGIQTAPAVAKLAASMLVSDILPPANIDESLYHPDRLR